MNSDGEEVLWNTIVTSGQKRNSPLQEQRRKDGKKEAPQTSGSSYNQNYFF